MNTENSQHIGSTVEEAKSTLERALREWKQQELVAKNQIDSIQKALAALNEGHEVRELVIGAQPTTGAQPVLGDMWNTATPLPERKTKAKAGKLKVVESGVTVSRDQLPSTGGDWFLSVLSRDYQFKADITVNTFMKAMEEMGADELTPDQQKKLKERLSFFLDYGVRNGTIKSKGAGRNRQFKK